MKCMKNVKTHILDDDVCVVLLKSKQKDNI